MDGLVGLLVLQVTLQHGRQPALAAVLRLQRGQGPALPGGTGLAGGRPGLDDGQQLVDLPGRDPGILQPMAGGGQVPVGRSLAKRAAARAARSWLRMSINSDTYPMDALRVNLSCH